MLLRVRGLIVVSALSVTAVARQAASDVLRAFGRAVRILRRQRGLSQEALAELSELDRTYVGSVERGERNLSLINITRLAAALGVRASELLREAER